MTWYEIGFGAIILAATATYTIITLSYLATMWVLRKEFNVAVRSPLLAIMSGISGTCISGAVIFQIMLDQDQLGANWMDGGVAEMCIIPLAFSTFTMPYAIRGLRLVIMYNPSMRRRWGRVLRERAVVKTLLALFVVMEAIVWLANLAYDKDWMIRLEYVLVGADGLVTLGMCTVLVGKLRTIQDLFQMSLELQWVALFTLASLAMVPLVKFVPAWLQPYVTMLMLAGRFHTALWFTNIQPIRAVLQQREDYHTDSVCALLFPIVPWSRSSKVAIGADQNNFISAWRRSSDGKARRSSDGNARFDHDLDRILKLPPLLQAFEEFCQRALCIESLYFLVAVVEFDKSIIASAETNDNTDFETFMEIVEKYIKAKSTFEVNIGSKTKSAVLNMANAASFKELTVGDRSHILDDAAKEVGQVLSDNLYKRFKETEEYKAICAMLFSVESPGGGKK